jgi:hypothetical protein
MKKIIAITAMLFFVSAGKSIAQKHTEAKLPQKQ